MAFSQTPAQFFKDNHIQVVVGFGAGGGTDTAARTVTAFWSKFVGGIAKINNMPGGGTVVACNYVWRAKPDGSTLMVTPFGTSLAATSLFGAPGMRFDPGKFTYIAMFADDPPAFAISKSLPYNNLEQLKNAKVLKLGATSAKGMPPFGDVTMLHVLGIPPSRGRVVTGYNSAPEVGLAVKQGELQGLVFSTNSIMKEDKKGVTKAMATVAFRGTPLLPGVKPVNQQLHLNHDQMQILKLYAAAFKTGRVILGPPGMKPAMVRYLRARIWKLFHSPEYKALAVKVFGHWQQPLSGPGVEKLIAEVKAMPKSEVDRMQSLAKQYIR